MAVGGAEFIPFSMSRGLISAVERPSSEGFARSEREGNLKAAVEFDSLHDLWHYWAEIVDLGGQILTSIEYFKWKSSILAGGIGAIGEAICSPDNGSLLPGLLMGQDFEEGSRRL